jgi:hypothetical protein
MDAEKFADELVLQYVRGLVASGLTYDEVNQILMQRGSEIERWRRETLMQVKRFVDEPFAPTVEAQ